MPWFRIDDGWHGHPKVIAAGNAAAGLWARCGAYCAQQLTEGMVPAAIAKGYGSKREIDRLTEVGLWVPVEGGYLIPDFLEYNPSAEKVKADRAAAAERQRKHRESQRDIQRESHDPGPARPHPANVSDSQRQLESYPALAPAAAEAVELLVAHRIATKHPDNPPAFGAKVRRDAQAEHWLELNTHAGTEDARWLAEHVLGMTRDHVIEAAFHQRRNAS